MGGVAEAAESMGHRRDVQGGTIRACTTCGIGGGTKSTGGSAGVRHLAGHGAEDAAVCGAAGVSAAANGKAAQAGAVAGHH